MNSNIHMPEPTTPPGFSLAGKIAIITGAGRGLGLEIARAYASAGAKVFINGRDAQVLRDATATIGGGAEALPFDVVDERAVAAAFEYIDAHYGHFDILVNNVGARDRRDLFEFTLDDVRRLLETDLLSAFHLSRQAARRMVAQRSGRIINMTSVSAEIAAPGDTAYIMAKGGLSAMTRALAAELGPYGITVNAIAPGPFATETNAALAKNPASAAWLSQRSSLGRWGQPHEIGGAAVFLASAAASYVTGHVLAVDGGLLAHY